jgi:hypothetical protein
VQSISWSDDFGATWITLDEILTPGEDDAVWGLHPESEDGSASADKEEVKGESQGNVHFSLLAHPLDKNIVFVGGDSQRSPFPNFVGAQGFTGRLFRGNASVTGTGGIPSPQWYVRIFFVSLALISLP